MSARASPGEIRVCYARKAASRSALLLRALVVRAFAALNPAAGAGGVAIAGSPAPAKSRVSRANGLPEMSNARVAVYTGGSVNGLTAVPNSPDNNHTFTGIRGITYFIAVDSAQAKASVEAFIESLGLRPLDVGGLNMAHWLEGTGLVLMGLARYGVDNFDVALGATEFSG